MAVKESEAFVLMTYPLAEADKIVVLFTRLYGKIRAVARGARRPKSRFGACLEPLSEIFASFFEKEARELAVLRRCELLCSPFERAATPEGEAFLYHVAELVDAFQPPSEPHPSVYRLIRAARDAFLQGAPLLPLAVYVEMWMLKLSGFFAPLEACAACGRAFRSEDPVWIARDGTPRCERCGAALGGHVISAHYRSLLAEMLKRPPNEWASLPISQEALHLHRLLTRLLQDVLERELKTKLLLNV
ncbi:MAG: DNA repair protein RecO [Blastocatellia bacterium]|nr:DNA repair protein RecO [Blastocatellia bacterium]MCS7157131.1 DNA repair protein RecO [Blastocatellia bacterium]MCX7752406.1 DNA repair protein RecO [Blastocatellia bacterium]MDW8167289.1 DNA repair protein RecO [Acidobacteriota bacterium]